MQTCQLVTLTLEVSGCVFSKLCLGELAVNAMPVSSVGDVCGVPTELLCVRQVFDFVDASCQQHCNTHNVGVLAAQWAKVCPVLIQYMLHLLPYFSQSFLSLSTLK